jgi:hypothetical protein
MQEKESSIGNLTLGHPERLLTNMNRRRKSDGFDNSTSFGP